MNTAVTPALSPQGANGMRVGFGDSVYTEHNATIRVPIREGGAQGWYLLRDGVRDISTRLRRTGEESESAHRGDAAGRHQLLSVLADVQHVLVRAKYHTDQVEGSLQSAVLQRGEPARSEDAPVTLTLVEQCACPDGYVGLSCESCAWGYARVAADGANATATAGLASGHRGLCARCNCNGHAATCDPNSNVCGVSVLPPSSSANADPERTRSRNAMLPMPSGLRSPHRRRAVRALRRRLFRRRAPRATR